MEKNFTCESRTNNDLHSKDGISNVNLFGLTVVFFVDFFMPFPLLIVAIFYVCCRRRINKHAKNCKFCTNPTSTRMVCEQSKTKKVRFCRMIERWTVWLLVDLFRTPNVKKKKMNENFHLKIGVHYSGELGKRAFITGFTYICITFIFCILIKKVIVDLFMKISSHCHHKGDFDIPAVCFAGDLISGTGHIIDCTGRNNNSESLGKDMGLLFCFSFWYDILGLMADVAGMFSLQTVTVQVILWIAKIFQRNKLCLGIYIVINILVVLSPIAGPILSAALDESSERNRSLEIWLEQFPPTLIAITSFVLPTSLLMSTNDLCDENKTPSPNRTHDSQGISVKEECTDKQSGKDTKKSLLSEKSPRAQYGSTDKRCSETTHEEDPKIAYKCSPVRYKKVRTTGEHKGGDTRRLQEPTSTEET